MFNEEWIELALDKGEADRVFGELRATEARLTDLPVLAGVLSVLECAGYFKEVGHEGNVFTDAGPDEKILYNLAKFAADLKKPRAAPTAGGGGNGGTGNHEATQSESIGEQVEADPDEVIEAQERDAETSAEESEPLAEGDDAVTGESDGFSTGLVGMSTGLSGAGVFAMAAPLPALTTALRTSLVL